MSLFISGLAFSNYAVLQDETKVGILMGSVVSAIIGYIFLRFAPLHADHAEMETASATEAKNAV